MAYTPGPGRTPMTVAIRLTTSTVAAVAAFAVARWWPFAGAPGEGVVLALFGIGLVAMLPGLALPKLVANRPARVVPLEDGVAIPTRRVTMAHAVYFPLTMWGLGGIFATANGMEGPRESPPVVWAAIAAILAFALAYLLVQRPWKRRIELRHGEVVLGAGEEASHIPWSDVAAIVQAPLTANARSGMKHMREYNAAAITINRHSDTERPRKRRLEDHYPTGDLACPFPSLLMALQYLHANPDERQMLADPDWVRRLLDSRSVPIR